MSFQVHTVALASGHPLRLFNTDLGLFVLVNELPALLRLSQAKTFEAIRRVQRNNAVRAHIRREFHAAGAIDSLGLKFTTIDAIEQVIQNDPRQSQVVVDDWHRIIEAINGLGIQLVGYDEENLDDDSDDVEPVAAIQQPPTLRLIVDNDLIVENNEVYTTSRRVAERFGKEHKNVLGDLERLHCSEEFRSANFSADLYLDTYGREQKQVKMTKDGFMFLVLGYNGSQAGEIRELYIAAFNEMRAFIERNRQDFTPKQQAEVAEIVDPQLAMLEAMLANRKDILTIKAEQAAGPLSNEQKVVALSKMKERYHELKYQFVVGSKDNKNSCPFIMKAIKDRFLPELPASQCRWEQISKREFDSLLEFIATWVPTVHQAKFMAPFKIKEVI